MLILRVWILFANVTCVIYILGDRLLEGSVITSWAIVNDVWGRIEETSWTSRIAQSSSISADHMEGWTWQKDCILTIGIYYVPYGLPAKLLSHV